MNTPVDEQSLTVEEMRLAKDAGPFQSRHTLEWIVDNTSYFLGYDERWHTDARMARRFLSQEEMDAKIRTLYADSTA